MVILNEYVAAVLRKAADYREAENFYDGRVGETFASSRLRDAMRGSGHRGQHNYARVVVDTVNNRLKVANIVAGTDKAQKAVNEVWRDNELDLESKEIHGKALEYGDCYALVWPDSNGDPLISYNSPRTTTIVYSPENPRKKLYAVKMWVIPAVGTTKGQTRMNVYFPDRIAKYVSDTEEAVDGTNWRSMGEETNPYGQIPVFHFRTHRPYGKPEHVNAYGPQNDINKLLASHFYTIDYQGAPQRYALGLTAGGPNDYDPDDDTAREQMGKLKSGPGEFWFLDGVSEVGEFKAADPETFWKPISYLKQSLAALTDTPFHYLERQVNIASGEGLRVAEAPLLKKVADRQESFGVTWVELFKFVLKVKGTPNAVLEVKWEDVESFDALDVWDVMLKKINAGLSHRQALREAGYAETEIERILAERAQEAAEGAYYQRKPDARVSTNDNETFDNRNGLTEQAKVNGGRGEPTA